MTMRLVILGAGGFAREVAWQLEPEVRGNELDLLGFAEEPGGAHLGCKVGGYLCHELGWYLKNFETFRGVIAIGSSKRREGVYQDLGRRRIALHTCVDPSVRLSSTVTVGPGTVICAGSTLTVDIEIGRCVQINPGCTLAHDTVIGDFVTIAPGAHISGNVIIERGCFIGTGASIVNGTPAKPIVIGEGTIIGAGACVVGDVNPFSTVAGVPARPITAEINQREALA